MQAPLRRLLFIIAFCLDGAYSSYKPELINWQHAQAPTRYIEDGYVTNQASDSPLPFPGSEHRPVTLDLLSPPPCRPREGAPKLLSLFPTPSTGAIDDSKEESTGSKRSRTAESNTDFSPTAKNFLTRGERELSDYASPISPTLKRKAQFDISGPTSYDARKPRAVDQHNLSTPQALHWVPDMNQLHSNSPVPEGIVVNKFSHSNRSPMQPFLKLKGGSISGTEDGNKERLLRSPWAGLEGNARSNIIDLTSYNLHESAAMNELILSVPRALRSKLNIDKLGLYNHAPGKTITKGFAHSESSPMQPPP